MACDQARLTAAKDAYDKLMTGQSARVVVDQNGERVEFSAINASKLQAYIAQLQSECDAEAAGTTPRKQRPMGFVF
jgi:hypothetical protein